MSEIWREMSSEELERQYSPSQWSKKFSPDECIRNHVKVAAEGSVHARATFSHQMAVPYTQGGTENQTLDIFLPDSLQNEAPILFYIHGGYWQVKSLSRSTSSYMAPTFLPAGVGLIATGYDLAPHATMHEITEQVKAATKYSMNLAAKRKSRGLYICGHSAGGHLSALMMSIDWSKEGVTDPDILKGCVLVSGVYDVRPIVHTSVNDPLHLTEGDAWDHSPEKYIKEICHQSEKRRIIVSVGTEDSPEFIRQAKQFAKRLLEGGVMVQYLEVNDVDHFDNTNNLLDPTSKISLASLRMING